MEVTKSRLSTLWIFATLNYLYCDVVPMAMVLLSRVLNYRAARRSNVIAGAVMTAVQLMTLFVHVPAPYYAFFSVIEIATTSAIVWYAWRWRVSAGQTRPAQVDAIAV